MPTPSRTRLLAIGGIVVAVLVIAMIVVASSGDDTNDNTGDDAATTTSGLVAIESPATVTGLTGVGAPTPVGGDAGSDGGTVEIARELVTGGAFDCATPGEWQPVAELDLTLRVGEPAEGTSCTSDVLDMPFGSCSTSPCDAVPNDWRVETRAGTAREELLLVVAPTGTGAAQFVCVVDLVARPKQLLLNTTNIDLACPPAGTSDSIDLPVVTTPDTDDIYVPPPVSVDIVGGG